MKELCDSFENFIWSNGKCYYLHNEEIQSFENARKLCFDKSKQHGFGNGKLFEPKSTESLQHVYKLAENLSKKPTLTIWLGMDDQLSEGRFTYSSDGTSLSSTIPWGRKSRTPQWVLEVPKVQLLGLQFYLTKLVFF